MSVITTPADPRVREAMRKLVRQEPKLRNNPAARHDYEQLFVRVVHADRVAEAAQRDRDQAWIFAGGCIILTAIVVWRAWMKK